MSFDMPQESFRKKDYNNHLINLVWLNMKIEIQNLMYHV